MLESSSYLFRLTVMAPSGLEARASKWVSREGAQSQVVMGALVEDLVLECAISLSHQAESGRTQEQLEADRA